MSDLRELSPDTREAIQIYAERFDNRDAFEVGMVLAELLALYGLVCEDAGRSKSAGAIEAVYLSAQQRAQDIRARIGRKQ